MKPRTGFKARCHSHCMRVSVTVKAANNSIYCKTRHHSYCLTVTVHVTVKTASYSNRLSHYIT